MARSKITDKYQVTIPRAVREKVGVKRGEVVTVEAISDDEIVLRRFAKVADPLKELIGAKARLRALPIEELEDAAESR